jgi:drug/metabolite transporter (DMT)-like permease
VPTDRRATVLVAAVAVLWGSVGLVVRQIDLPAATLVAGRVWIAAAALGLWLWRRDVTVGLRGRSPVRTVVNGAVLAVHWMCFIAALQRAPIGAVLLITYLAPVGIAALAPWVLGEPVRRATLVALALAVAGIALIAGPEAGGGDAAGLLLAGAAAATYVVVALLNKPLSGLHGGSSLAFLQLVVAGLVLVAPAAVAGWGSPGAASLLWLVVLGLVHTALAVGVYLSALTRLPATQVAVLLYLEPVSAVLFGWVVLSEALPVTTVAGGALVVAAGAIVGRGARSAAAVPAPAPHPEVSGVPR